MLSQYLIQHGKDFFHIDPTALYQTGNQLNVTHCCIVNISFFIGTRFRKSVLLVVSGGIQTLFLFLALWALIIFSASTVGALAPVGISAAERAAKITTTGISWMGKKQDLTMPAAGQALSQMGLLFENGSNNLVILSGDAAHLFLAIPVRNELKIRL